jgi:hypothetical protein
MVFTDAVWFMILAYVILRFSFLFLFSFQLVYFLLR